MASAAGSVAMMEDVEVEVALVAVVSAAADDFGVGDSGSGAGRFLEAGNSPSFCEVAGVLWAGVGAPFTRGPNGEAKLLNRDPKNDRLGLLVVVQNEGR